MRASLCGSQSETLLQLARLQVTQTDGESICGVGWLGCFLHVQQCTHHHLHLALVGVPVTGDAGFYFTWRVAADFDVVLLGGEQHDATHFGKSQSGAHVQSSEDGLDRHSLRLKFIEQVAEQCVNFMEDGSRRILLTFCGNTKRSVVKDAAELAVGLQDAVASWARSRRVYTKHAKSAVGSCGQWIERSSKLFYGQEEAASNII